jgi:hypothetical protein
MGATLFRREALDRIEFRWETNRCECQCCCDDLRKLGIEIAYSRTARATHLRSSRIRSNQKHATVDTSHSMPSRESPPAAGRILTAFDRHHYKRFRDKFLTSLRAAGNDEFVIVVGYGLFPSQQRALVRLRNVELVSLPSQQRASPARRRLHDFQAIVSRMPDATPVAYWDAGDVIFQSRLSSLWAEVQAHPGKLLVTHEPDRHVESMRGWTLSIRDPAARDYARQLLASRPCLNGGFAAATANTMLKYLQAAERLRNSTALEGTTSGDQMAMNIFCRSNPEQWHEIDESWNYCLYGRDRERIRAGYDGRIASNGRAPYVVHGNAQTLPKVRGYRYVCRVLAAKRRSRAH